MHFRLEFLAAIKIQTVDLRIKKLCIVLGGCYMIPPTVTLQKRPFCDRVSFCVTFILPVSKPKLRKQHR